MGRAALAVLGDGGGGVSAGTSQKLGEDRTSSLWRRGDLLAMSQVLGEDRTSSPWRRGVGALVGLELHCSLCVPTILLGGL